MNSASSPLAGHSPVGLVKRLTRFTDSHVQVVNRHLGVEGPLDQDAQTILELSLSSPGHVPRRKPKTTPAPLLVGIEPNPGPTRPKKRKSNVTLTVSSSAPPVMTPSRRRPRRARKNRSLSRLAGPVTSSYVRSLLDPFRVTPPRIGFGTMIPTSKSSMFWRGTYTIPAASYGLVLIRPGFNGLIFNTLPAASHASAWSLGTVANQQYTNLANLQTRYQSTRPITGGTRLTVLNAATNAPPIVAAGLIYDTSNNITGLTPDQTIGESQLSPIQTINQRYQVTWRPSDAGDYLLTNTYLGSGLGGTGLFAHQVFYINNAANTNSLLVMFDAIWHIEGNSGVDVVGEDETGDADSLASENPNLETVGAMVTKLDVPLLTAVDDTAVGLSIVDQMIRERGPRGFSLRTEGGYVESSSSSRLPFLGQRVGG